jgi:small subunit ribosomal protein S16
MALKLRLSRGGSKKRPYYRIVVTEATAPRDGNFLERVGTYNPMLPREHEDRVRLSKDRIQHWLDHGAQPTDRVQRLLAQADMMAAPAIPTQTKKNQPKAKAQERIREAEARAKDAADAAAAAVAAAAEASAAPEAEAGSEEAAAE